MSLFRNTVVLATRGVRMMQARTYADGAMKLTFAAANKVFYDQAEVKQVDVPSFSGDFGILAAHVPTLGKSLYITQRGQRFTHMKLIYPKRSRPEAGRRFSLRERRIDQEGVRLIRHCDRQRRFVRAGAGRGSSRCRGSWCSRCPGNALRCPDQVGVGQGRQGTVGGHHCRWGRWADRCSCQVNSLKAHNFHQHCWARNRIYGNSG